MYRRLTVLAVSGLLAACGGGGGGDDNGNSTGLGGNGGGSTAPESVTITAASVNECGQQIPFANAEVIFHNASGAIVSEQALGSTGTAELQWPSSAQHISIAAMVDYGSDDVVTRVNTYANVAGIRQLPTTFFVNSSNENYQCGCQDVVVDSTMLAMNYPNHSLRAMNTYSGWRQTLNRDNNAIRVCPTEDGGWQSLDLVAEPIGGTGVSAYRATLSIDPTVSSTYTLDQNVLIDGDMATELTVTVDNDFRYIRTFTDTSMGRSSHLFAFGQDAVSYFPQLDGRPQATAYYSEPVVSLPEGDADYFASSRSLIVDGEVTISMKTNQLMFVNEAARLITNTIGDGTDTRYNFSALSEGKEWLDVELSGVSFGASWSIRAPLSGAMPEFDLPAIYLNELAEITQPRVFVRTSGYGHSGSYQEILEQLATEAAKGNPRSEYFDEYSYEYLSVFAN